MNLKYLDKETETNVTADSAAETLLHEGADSDDNRSLAVRSGFSVGRNRKGLWRHLDFVVVACILMLAILLGVLNNLRVAGERRVKWFGAPAILDDLETTEEITP